VQGKAPLRKSSAASRQVLNLELLGVFFVVVVGSMKSIGWQELVHVTHERREVEKLFHAR
jgi:hypothetical protein